MNKETFIKRISPILTAKKAIPVRYYTAFDYLERMSQGEKIKPFSWSRSRGHNNLSGKSDASNLRQICGLLRLKLQRGNDSPRYGKANEYFCLSAKECRKLKGINFSELPK